MVEPLFPHKVTSNFWSGVVDRIEEGNVGWGSRDGSGGTFDMPLPPGFGVGTLIEFYDAGEEADFDYVVAIRSDQSCWLLTLDETFDGYEIVGCSEFVKAH